MKPIVEYIEPPYYCPACRSVLITEGDYLLCRGEECPAQVVGAISRWCEKIGVDGLGPAVVEALVDHAGVVDIADLYTMDPKKIETVPLAAGHKIGKNAYSIVQDLKDKSEIPLHIFVGSLGIPHCARTVCKMIVDAGLDDLTKMMNATVADLEKIPGLGSIKAVSFVGGFAAKYDLMEKLLASGVRIKAKSVGVLTGKSVCMTGFRSPELEKAIEDAGGTIKSSVGAGLTYLVCKDPKSGSVKLKKAESLGVTLMDVDGMWTLIKSGQVKTISLPKKTKVEEDVSIFDLFG